jgi:hypothetical protein
MLLQRRCITYKTLHARGCGLLAYVRSIPQARATVFNIPTALVVLMNNPAVSLPPRILLFALEFSIRKHVDRVGERRETRTAQTLRLHNPRDNVRSARV